MTVQRKYGTFGGEVSPIFLCGGGKPVPDTETDCADRDKHTPTPAGYVDRAEWAGQMLYRGARQQRCPTCGLYAVWTTPNRPMPDEAEAS